MEDSYAHLQRGGVQSVSGTLDDTYEQVRLSMQPTGKRQIQSPTTTTTAVKVILGLLGSVVLVALVVALVALVLNQQPNYVLMKKMSSLEQMVHKLQADVDMLTGTKLPQSSPTGTASSTTPASAVPTASTSATFVSPTDSRLTSCTAIHSSDPSAPSGVYTIHIGGSVQGRKVWCDMVTDGGGWTMFQRRQDGSVRFNRTWSEYKTGFGSVNSEFWLGNDDLHTLTSAHPSELRVDLSDWEGNHRYATYSSFDLSRESTNYRLYVSGYNGTAGDALRHSNNMLFSTIDNDHDTHNNLHCAAYFGGGGWWLGKCGSSNLNGRYFFGGTSDQPVTYGLYWYQWRNYYSYKTASMMTRPRQ